MNIIVKKCKRHGELKISDCHFLYQCKKCRKLLKKRWNKRNPNLPSPGSISSKNLTKSYLMVVTKAYTGLPAKDITSQMLLITKKRLIDKRKKRNERD